MDCSFSGYIPIFIDSSCIVEPTCSSTAAVLIPSGVTINLKLQPQIHIMEYMKRTVVAEDSLAAVDFKKICMQTEFGSYKENQYVEGEENTSVEHHMPKYIHVEDDAKSTVIKREPPEVQEGVLPEVLQEGSTQKVLQEGSTQEVIQEGNNVDKDGTSRELEFVPVKEEPSDTYEYQQEVPSDASTSCVKQEPKELRNEKDAVKQEVNDCSTGGTSVICDSDFTPLESAFYPTVEMGIGSPEGACQAALVVQEIKSVHSGASKKYECNLCNYTCAQRYNLASHQLARHGVGEPFKCDFCCYTCAQKGSLKAHQISKHGLGIPFKCDICDYTCALKCNLKDHQVSKHGPRLTFNCDLCNYSCSQKRSLKMHQISKHGSGEQPYKCEFCDYTCARKIQLKLHKVSKHSLGDPFLCHLCDYSCPDRYNLKCHQFAKHGIGESHKCEFCNFSSAHTSSFKRHQLAKHGIGEPLKCRICDYSTAYPNVLKQHVTTAHNIGEFLRCDLCDYSTTIKSHMKRHKLGKHSTSLTEVCKDHSLDFK
ncbi:Zinc finger C2H2-type [Trinorchestia longiramus]|nr:Zinc finger C2H2-type [Trinorchestia longiramus]